MADLFIENIFCSIGRLVRSIAESDPRANTENHSIKEAIAAGEMVAKKSIDKLIENQLLLLSDKKGVIIDGYPRDMNHVKDFEAKVSHYFYWFFLFCFNHPSTSTFNSILQHTTKAYLFPLFYQLTVYNIL